MLSVSAMGGEVDLSYDSNLSLANQRHASAQFNLGVKYVKGQGVCQDYKKAKDWYGKACDNGDQKGCDGYKDLNQRGF